MHTSTVTLHCRAYSVGLNFSFFHLGQEISGGELELILQVNLQQGIIVTDIVLCTWGGQITVTPTTSSSFSAVAGNRHEPRYNDLHAL